jgi:hypothetical protein
VWRDVGLVPDLVEVDLVGVACCERGDKGPIFGALVGRGEAVRLVGERASPRGRCIQDGNQLQTVGISGLDDAVPGGPTVALALRLYVGPRESLADPEQIGGLNLIENRGEFGTVILLKLHIDAQGLVERRGDIRRRSTPHALAGTAALLPRKTSGGEQGTKPYSVQSENQDRPQPTGRNGA